MGVHHGISDWVYPKIAYFGRGKLITSDTFVEFVARLLPETESGWQWEEQCPEIAVVFGLKTM